MLYNYILKLYNIFFILYLIISCKQSNILYVILLLITKILMNFQLFSKYNSKY